MLNGHRFVGWAEDDPPYEFEYEDASELKRGQDGGLYGMSMPSFGGILTIKLQPSSPTTQWCIQQEQIRKNLMKSKAQDRIYRGTISDPAVGITAELSGGIIVQLPAWPIGNQTYEGRFDFEEITSQVDGGTFHPPLMSNA